ncbi:MAG: quinolinate synthase NadA [Methanomicrobiales archaeon]|nr:quinolinate synthase NadA [Methanomicrobiales archaeon]
MNRIEELKREKNAVILAHNYQLPEVREVADIIGDSLELAVRAKEATADLIVFCGVRFMAETAKILNPSRKVIMPVEDAGCPLADQLTPEMIADAKAAYPDAAVVLYVNSSAGCKALADIVCTSANAVAVVRSLSETTVLFGPDANLAGYVQRQLPDRRIIPLPPGGHCYVHHDFSLADVEEARQRGGSIICHPECPAEVQAAADVIASTGGMVRRAPEQPVWNVFTEKEMVSRLKELYPDRIFYAKDGAICHDMKKTRRADVLRALETEEFEVTVPEAVMDRARRAIERMIAVP